MLGFELPLTISLENLIRYHAGLFGFTGAGKSNLTSVLLRKVMKSKTDIAVVVIDISGEYATHLIDLLEDGRRILSYETMEDDGAALQLAGDTREPGGLRQRQGDPGHILGPAGEEAGPEALGRSGELHRSTSQPSRSCSLRPQRTGSRAPWSRR